MTLSMNGICVRIARALVKLSGRLPLNFHYAIGSFVSWIIKDVAHYRRDVVTANLARSFPEKKYKELGQIADRYYTHLGEIMAEALWFGASDYRRLYESGVVTVNSPEVLNGMFASSPSLTVLYSHCGNWEMLGGLLGFRTASGERLMMDESQVKVVYKRQRSSFSDGFFRLNRSAPLVSAGTSCEIESGDILRYAVRHKDEKTMYIYMADQYPYQAPYEVGEFMCQPTKAMLGSVRVAHKFSHGVVYMKMRHAGRGKYEIDFIPICADASSVSPEELLRRYFDLLEEEIRETPHNWLWSHKRWK